MSVFQRVNANIMDNGNLYEAQIEAYEATRKYYEQFTDYRDREVLIVMPTGSGKTGLMSILPFNNCNGKVLLITPGKVVRRTVFEEFDSIHNPQDTFLYKQKVILRGIDLPKAYLYTGYKKDSERERSITISKLKEADIVITNVHRLNSSSKEVNLMKIVREDFFDMIIIDEAHHVAATMWQEALSYFKASKVIKLTATPFRADKIEITNNPRDPIYEYTLGEAIHDGLLKEVIKEVEIPGELEFIDNETGDRLSLNQAKVKFNNDWINKSVALSEVCSKQIIRQTKDILIEKRKSYPNHRVLAITCNDEHAQMICKWFNDADLIATYVSTNSNNEKENDVRLTDFANGKYDVMVSIQMLGEGYNNPDISIISIFRPFKSLTPYAQAIGRGLRKIHSAQYEIDNFCNVIYHKELGLDKLWEYYKKQKTYAETIKDQKKFVSEQLDMLEEMGFVEVRPSKKMIVSLDEKELELVPQLLGQVTRYTSKGVGEGDAFSPNGLERYIAARKEQALKITAKRDEEIVRLRELVEKGFISKNQGDILIKQQEDFAQNKIDNSLRDEGMEYLKSESYRKEFKTWFNIQIEEFFSKSKLEKKGMELAKSNHQLENSLADNIGWITKQIREAIYQKLKKRIGEYTPKDYAVVKMVVVDSLSFYLDEHGLNE